MILLDIIPLLDSLLRYLKEQWSSLWCQTRSSISSCPKRSSVEHSLAISSLVSLAPTVYLSNYYKLVWIWDGLSVRVMRSSPASRLLSWPKIRVFHVSPQRASLVRSSRVANMGGSGPFWYLMMSFGYRWPMKPSLVGAEGPDRASGLGFEVGVSVSFSLGGPGSLVGSTKGGSRGDS